MLALEIEMGILIEHISNGDRYINLVPDIRMSILLEDKHVCGLSLVINIRMSRRYGLELQSLHKDCGTRRLILTQT